MARERFPTILYADEVMEPQIQQQQGEKTMGTAQAQGELWGVQVQNWANLQEKMQLPAYKIVFDQTNVARGARLLHVGCGSGLAAHLAGKLGTYVTGVHASKAKLAIDRES